MSPTSIILRKTVIMEVEMSAWIKTFCRDKTYREKKYMLL